MSRAGDYLKQTLTPEQYAEYMRHAALDGRDSTAREKWESVRALRNVEDGEVYKDIARFVRERQTAIAWLKRYGYLTDDEQWTGITTEKRR